ncbi:MAG TPA: hypothetical protein VJN02_05240 [Gammaproteobacteria bacterium]|nr:hypothetical protein [Gammaproteobacteria bacterium]
MILFVNVFITDERGSPSAYKDLSPTHRIHSKFDVFKYTLASYSVIKWTSTIFYIKLDHKFIPYRKALEEFIYELFPNNSKIYDYRLDSYEQWTEAIKLPELTDETWIWFTCNDDHPFIDSSLGNLEHLIKLASQLSAEQNKYISIFPTHWSEVISSKKRYLKVKNKPYHRRYESGSILEDNHDYFLTTSRNCISIQILTKKLLNLWFSDPNRCPQDLRRTDVITPPEEQITMIPYRELARHFDAYSHSGVPHEIIPPMFIPLGFFEKQIKIQYGGNKRIPEYVFIHPEKEMIPQEMSHRERQSNDLCDINIVYEDIPLFWKDRIADIRHYDIPSDTVFRNYIKQKIRVACADPRFGYTPSEAIRALAPIFYQKYNPSFKELQSIAKSAWNLKEKILYNWRIFKYSHLTTIQYSLLTYIRLKYPSVWKLGKRINSMISQL